MSLRQGQGQALGTVERANLFFIVENGNLHKNTIGNFNKPFMSKIPDFTILIVIMRSISRKKVIIVTKSANRDIFLKDFSWQDNFHSYNRGNR